MSDTLRSWIFAGTLLASAVPVSAQVFTLSMTPDQVVPPTPSTASGQGTLRLEAGNMLSFDITLGGLHGGETEAAVHGPARAGANAGVLFGLPLGNSKTGTLGPLAPQQLADLEAGLWYIAIHTSHHPNGEIRGQIRNALAVETPGWGAVKRLYRNN